MNKYLLSIKYKSGAVVDLTYEDDLWFIGDLALRLAEASKNNDVTEWVVTPL